MAKKKLPIATEASEPKRDEQAEMKMKAKYALDDIERAEMHKKDKALMKHVKAHAREKMKALGKIC